MSFQSKPSQQKISLQNHISVQDPLSDISMVLREHRMPLEFPDSLRKELEYIPDHVKANDKKGRKDLTNLDFITIDGITAKDFDDAIYVEKKKTGFRALIAIADVSYYVRPHTQIDRHAYQRGNSTYFPNYMTPMLPEKLSNGICSLNPQKERLAVVADLQLNTKGDVLSSKFYEAVIQTTARTTYKEIQSLLDGEDMSHLSHIKEFIFHASHLTKLLLAKRVPKLSLDLDIPEYHLSVDEHGYAVDIKKTHRLFSHRMIEELMLLANVSVAQFLKTHKIPAIYRVHEKPDKEDIDSLNHFLRHLESSMELHPFHVRQKKINKILKKFKQTQYAPILNIMVLRSMKQACYSHKAFGHFGLGFDDYLHFTSPIRRYSDLVVHRQLKKQLGLEKKALNAKELEPIGVHLSACEQRSVKAERQLLAIKKARLMENLISQEFEGIITAITRFGIFVLLTEFDVDGMLRLSYLAKGSFVFDEKFLYLQSKRTKKMYRVGDLIQVRVDRVDIASGKVGFTLPSHSLGDKKHGSFHRRKKTSKKHKKCD